MPSTKHADGLELNDNDTVSPLQRIDTVGSIPLASEQFERMYLGPQNRVKGDLRNNFAKLTPIGLGGFLLALTPLFCQYMGWQGTLMANGLPILGSYIFLHGLLAILACIGEFILGNSFPACFFGVYGAIFLTYGAFHHASAANQIHQSINHIQPVETPRGRV